MLGFKLKFLERKVTKALGVITSTIAELESANAEYEVAKEKIGAEITALTDTHIDVHNKIKENNTIINNFKNLLK